jgi:hypothetical protein
MSGTFPPATSLVTGPSGGAPRRRLPRPGPWAIRVASVVALAVVVVVAAAVIPGSHAQSAHPAVAARLTSRSPVGGVVRSRQTKVFGSDVAASRYGTQISQRENGIGPDGQIASDLTPLPPTAFDRPIAAYRSYAEQWSAKLGAAVTRLHATLAANDRTASESAWDTAFADYLHLGAVYGLVPDTLNRQLAGVPPTVGERDFPGLHRIEMGLWTGAAPRSLMPLATAIGRAVAELRRTLPSVPILPLDYATRAHEILEDAQRDYMSGSDVPWSQAGVLATEAGVLATDKVISTLVPLLEGRDNTLAESQNWLGRLQATLLSVRRRDGSWPSLQQLTTAQRERVDGSLAGTLGALAQVPGTLETVGLPVIPTIASQAASQAARR